MTPPPTATATAADCELVISRVFDAPRELVFAAWTSPEHLPHWYGPRGFTTSIAKMDARAGGTAELTMRGPDGAEYHSAIVYDEVEPPARLAYRTRGGKAGSEPEQFRTIVTFEASGDHASRTTLTIRHVFPSASARDANVAKYHSDVGATQTLERLAHHLGDAKFYAPADQPIVMMTRVLDAPRHLVFVAISQPEHIARWWGPRNTKLTTCEVDARVGGAYRFVLEGADGKRHPFAGEYLEISPPGRLVYTERYDVEPYKQYVETVTVTLADVGAKTVLTLVEQFPSQQARDGKLAAGTRGGAIESHDRLVELLADIAPSGKELVIQRRFAAPRALVYAAFTEPEHVKQWIAPKPLTTPVFEVDLRPGGALRMVMAMPDGTQLESLGSVLEVEPPSRFGWKGVIHGGVHVETHVTFTDAADDDGAGTLVVVRQSYSAVSPATRGAKMGWTSSLDQLAQVIRALA